MMSDSSIQDIGELTLLDFLRLPVELRRDLFCGLAPAHRLAYIDAYCEFDASLLTQGAIMENVISDPLTDILNGENVRQRKEFQAGLVAQELSLVRSSVQNSESNVKPFPGDNDE